MRPARSASTLRKTALKQALEPLLLEALNRLAGGLLPGPVDPKLLVIERTRDPANGDFATNVAMRLAKAAGLKPRDLAQAIVDALPASPQVAKVEVAGAGFMVARWPARVRASGWPPARRPAAASVGIAA